MATPTSNYGFIKDAPTQLYDVQVVNANLDSIDAQIKARENATNANNSALSARISTLENLFTKDVAPSITNALTAAAGWTLTEQQVWAWGPIVQVKISATRTGATISGSGNGNIANTLIASWTGAGANYKPLPAQEIGISVADAGELWGGIVSTSGISVCAISPNASIAATEVLRGSCVYMRNMP